MSAALATPLVAKLGELLIQEYQLLSGVRGNVVILREEAAIMNALLRMRSETDEDGVDHFVREWMKQVRELAYDGEDCIELFVRRIGSPRGETDCLGRRWHKFITYCPRRRLANDIKDLSARATAMSERHARYGAYGKKLQPSVAFGSRLPMSSTLGLLAGATNDPSQVLVGDAMRDGITTLVREVNKDDPNELAVYSIVGIGGVGKSTLAAAVVRGIQRHFQCRAHVSVPQHFHGKNDLDILMNSIHKQFGYEDSTDDVNGLERHLSDKRYLIVIEDVWTTSAWNGIRKRLPRTNNKSSRIILTTRIQNVAIGLGYTHHVNILNYEDSKKLFLNRVFGQTIADAAPNDGQLTPNPPAAAPNDGQQNPPVRDHTNVDQQTSSPPPAAPNDDQQNPSVTDHTNVDQQTSSPPAAAPNDGQQNPSVIDHTNVDQQTSSPPAAAPNDGQQTLNSDDQQTPNSLAATHNNRCPVALQAEMKEIIKKCGGLPLTIVNVAGILASYNSPTSTNIGMWKRVKRSVGSQLETNPAALDVTMQIVAFSYNHLPHPLKACALLLSNFPQSYHIPKWRLHRRWIAEGLIPEKRGLTLLDVAEAYCDELLSRNICQLPVLENGTVSEGHCCVHGMMHEVILSKALEENFVSLVGSPHGGTSYDPVRRLYIHGDVGYVADGRSMHHVRSLTTFGLKKNDGVGKLLGGLAKFTLLRVLELEDCQDVTNNHMKQVCRLFLLRLLNLNGTNITVLPSEISNLQHLQSLMLWDTQLDKVPRSVVHLEKLEYLSFQKKDKPDIKLKLPPGIKKMKALQKLTRLQIGKGDGKLADEIGELAQLRELGVFLLWDCGPEVQAKVDASVGKLSLRGEADIEKQPQPQQAPSACCCC